MEKGAYGYSIPTFPSHTPTNFATLLTGTYPVKHGVADGPMHIEGHPLSKVSVGGFSSAAKKVDPIWVTMEKSYNKNIVLLSIPGSTPPELDQGITIRGRWGGWGADFHAINFEEKRDNAMKITQGRGSRLFFFGPPLTKYEEATELEGTIYIEEKEDDENDEILNLQSYSNIKEVTLINYGVPIVALIYDNTNNKKTDYDKILFSIKKTKIVADLREGEWSDWIAATLIWKVGQQEVPIPSFLKIKIIKLEDDGFFRIRIFYNNLNKYVAKPSYVADEIVNHVGPMTDFVDNFPPQLIYYDEDKETFLEEARMSLDWHKKAASFILEKYHPDIFIHDVYTPNQMLTSRWWMGYVDPASSRYHDVTKDQRKQLWREVKEMYKKLDDIIGEFLKKADKNTYVVLSSDHGAVPLDKWVRLNNLFAEKGWLKFEINPNTGEPLIDWENSKAVYLKMAHVYISTKGLGGNWKRDSGKEYEEFREEVKKVLLELEDKETQIRPVIAAYNWEDAPQRLLLPTDRVGDLVLINDAGYGWNEEVTADKKIFGIPLKSGYKQAILAEQEKGMWTPFIIMGPRIKNGFHFKKPIHHADQYSTIMSLLGGELRPDIDGKVLNEILK